MRVIPIDQAPDRFGFLLGLSITPDTDDTGHQKTDRDDVLIWRVECLHRLPRMSSMASSPRSEVEIVKIASARPPVVGEMQPVTFVRLIARPWQMEGRSGITLWADGVEVAD